MADAESKVKRLVVFLARQLFSYKPVPFFPEKVHRILVVRQHDQLGDMICVIPTLRTLRNHFPSARISLVASPVNCEIMWHNKLIDEVINYDKVAFRKSPDGLSKFIKQIRSRNFDLAVVPSTVSLSLTSDLIARFSGAKWRVGASTLNGVANETSFLFTHTANLDWRDDPHRHQALRNADVLSAIGIGPDSNLECNLGLSDKERAAAEEELRSLRKSKQLLIGLHPGAGKPGNRWDVQKFARVADTLARDHSVGLVITAGPMDNEVISEFLNHIAAEYHLVRNRPLRQVAALLDQLDLVISNDTGILHIAGGLKPKVLGLFGPTDPLQWAPIGEKNRYVSAEGEINQIEENQVLHLANELLFNALAKGL